MDMLTREDLRTLIGKRQEACVTIYMPTHRVGREIQQDPIRLKNLLGQTEERLVDGGLRTTEAQALLEPAQRLLQHGLFWQQQSDGLAIFLATNVFHHYRLPFDFEELVVVTDRFHVKPLLPLFSGDGRFYILALSQDGLRLLQGTRYSVGAVDLQEVPTSLAQALQYDDPESRLQFHTATPAPGRRGDRPAVFHGRGVGTNNAKDNILRYFHQVNEGVHALLREEQAPLVLAGVEYLHPIYEEANTYPHLVDEGIAGNPEELSAEELHRQAWAIVQPVFAAAQAEAAALYRQLAGSGSEQATDDLRAIVSAAHRGRVATLFVAVGEQQWGFFDPQAGMLRLHEEAQPSDEDLLDFAAVQTLVNGGTVYAVAPDQMPDETSVAAVFRY
jgi:hypothetical protein